MRNIYNNLSGGSIPRLSALRAAAVKLAANANRNMQTAANPTWRTVRHSRFSSPYPKACPGFNDKAPILSAFDVHHLPIRGHKWADMVDGSLIGHHGWYASDDASRGTVRGFVASLPHGKFLPGYYWSDNGEFVLFYGESFDSADDCASDADYQAEKFAELCRDDAAKFDAMIDAEINAGDARQEFCTLWPARGISETLRGRVREALQAIRDARDSLRDATQAYEGA